MITVPTTHNMQAQETGKTTHKASTASPSNDLISAKIVETKAGRTMIQLENLRAPVRGAHGDDAKKTWKVDLKCLKCGANLD
jgi:hypothetical protein